MTSDTGQSYQILKESYFHRQWGDTSIGRWDLSFVAGSGKRQIDWLFSCDPDLDGVPRGYFDSVRQRFDVGQQLPQASCLLTTAHCEADSAEILVEAVEGESLGG